VRSVLHVNGDQEARLEAPDLLVGTLQEAAQDRWRAVQR